MGARSAGGWVAESRVSPADLQTCTRNRQSVGRLEWCPLLGAARKLWLLQAAVGWAAREDARSRGEQQLQIWRESSRCV